MAPYGVIAFRVRQRRAISHANADADCNSRRGRKQGSPDRGHSENRFRRSSIVSNPRPHTSLPLRMVNAAGSLSSNLEDTSEIPAVAEPFFLEYDAKVTFSAVMNAQDLAKAAPGIEKAVKEHGQAIAA
jgi:hypothetical protein